MLRSTHGRDGSGTGALSTDGPDRRSTDGQSPPHPIGPAEDSRSPWPDRSFDGGRTWASGSKLGAIAVPAGQTGRLHAPQGRPPQPRGQHPLLPQGHRQ
ncbi:hypothetical protein E6P78_02535 [Streptomyces sp. A0958]|nr:hypothetical protein E6P78_02535 [Streptomyces sp. A0958]